MLDWTDSLQAHTSLPSLSVPSHFAPPRSSLTLSISRSRSIVAAARIAEALGLPCTPSAVVEQVRNKLSLRRLSAKIGLPSPGAANVSLADVLLGRLRGVIEGCDEAEPPLALQGASSASSSSASSPAAPTAGDSITTTGKPLHFPLVVKPLSGAGSNFVRRVASRQELVDVAALFAQQTQGADERPRPAAAAAAVAAAVPSAAAPASPAAPTSPELLALLQGKWRHWGLDAPDAAFMLEELMVGDEVDLDMVVEGGKVRFMSVTDNFPSSGPKQYFMEAGKRDTQSSVPLIPSFFVLHLVQSTCFICISPHILSPLHP